MTEQQRPDWQRRFQDMKVGFNQSTTESQPLKEIDVNFPGTGFDSLYRSYQQLIVWFNGIPASGKLLAIAGGGLLSLMLIKTIFQLITSLITLTVFGIILYLVYRFWILPKGE